MFMCIRTNNSHSGRNKTDNLILQINVLTAGRGQLGVAVNEIGRQTMR